MSLDTTSSHDDASPEDAKSAVQQLATPTVENEAVVKPEDEHHQWCSLEHFNTPWMWAAAAAKVAMLLVLI